MCRAVVAAAYTKIDGKMEFLWDTALKMNTVHVFDVVRAIHFAAKKLEPHTGAQIAHMQGNGVMLSILLEGQTATSCGGCIHMKDASLRSCELGLWI